jgi:hypothetical protein
MTHFSMFKNNSTDSTTENVKEDIEKKLIVAENLVLKKRKVHFKFNQGFSNAVRRPVSITEFM